MKQEELVMRVRDLDRLKVLHEVRRGHIQQVKAARELGVTPRWVRELARRVRRQGDRGVIHRLRGRPSNRKIAMTVKRKALGIVRERRQQKQWHDYGPTLMAEELVTEHGIGVGKETLRKWLIEAKLWRPRRARVEKIHTWRPRREGFGELVQWDTSEHEWLEGRGEKMYLIAMIDDATSRALGRFVGHDSTAENMRLLGSYLERFGRPLEFYTDKASLFYTTPKACHHRDAPEQQPTQMGRALRELNIGWIAAHSPQAKGRVERFFGTAQDRLVKGLRKAGARTLEQANRYLEHVYLPMWNRRFIQPPANPHDAHRPLRRRQELASILSRVEQRGVSNDYTIRWEGRLYQLRRDQIRPALRGARVEVEQRLDETMWVRWGGQHLELAGCETAAGAAKPVHQVRERQANQRADPALVRQQRQRWMQQFWQRPAPSLRKAIAVSNARA